ncbi:hypothetical protein GH714_001440 [Hevea brasiliensis]|uniref:YTH domain-containing family protein n=1 Tax=Hevea brasiliensis TaxID=3981 RepID=A0A6A6M9R1_HEVBR|nr:hypothetical protein GH714_001440 [Hevea brasiliensis]
MQMGGWLLTANINPEGEAMVTLVFAMSINVLNELNRGPRAKGFKNQKGFAPVTLVVKGQNVPPSETVNEEKDELPTIPDREQYNKADSPKITVMVNTSGQFIGLVEMVGPVDFNKNMEYWQ